MWGKCETIISHMAFSNHLYHHLKRCDGHKKRFIDYFNRIIKSLDDDGCFVYAPGLPMIEDILLKKNILKIERKPLLKDLNTRFYSTKISIKK